MTDLLTDSLPHSLWSLLRALRCIDYCLYVRLASYLVPVYKPSGDKPSRKGELFYTKKPDTETANLIKNMRKTETKMRLKVGTET